MHNPGGKYLVSGTQSDESMGQTTAFNNDTIIITQCGDSSVYFTGNNAANTSGGWSYCCNYTSPNTSLYWPYTENYLYTYNTAKIKVGIFFPADQPGSIIITGNYYHCDGGATLSLTRVRIQ